MIRAIIFDIGGVVVTGRKGGSYGEVVKAVAVRTAINSGIDPKRYLEVWPPAFDAATKGSISCKEFLRRMSAATGASAATIRRAYLSSFFVPNKINAPMLSLAAKLKGRGYRVAALSNVDYLGAAAVRAAGAYSAFSPTVLSYRVRMAKPERRIYRLMLKRLNLQPQECVFIDDTKANVDAAASMGIHAIRFRGMPDLRKRLVGLGVRM